MHIVIAGNIGSGKTTLTKMLAEHYGWTPRFESVDYNPYIKDYYTDIQRWSFPMEVYFLKERFRDVIEIAQTDKVIIQDRSIFEGVYIFAANNKDMGNIDDRDYENYMNLFELMTKLTKTPDLMIYLKSSIQHLVDHIQKRGRDYEQTMSLDYLKSLNDRYNDFVENKYLGKVMVIDADNLDFLNNPKDFASITDRIDAFFFGLFPQRIPFEKDENSLVAFNSKT